MGYAKLLETFATLDPINFGQFVCTFFRLAFAWLSLLLIFYFFLMTLTVALVNVLAPEFVMIGTEVRLKSFFANWADDDVPVIFVKMHSAIVIVLSTVFSAVYF